MERIIVLFDKGPMTATDTAMIYCNSCDSITTTYAFKSEHTINKTALLCRSCGCPLTNVEELCKKQSERLKYHKNV